jgi:hypothetical protein
MQRPNEPDPPARSQWPRTCLLLAVVGLVVWIVVVTVVLKVLD